MKRLAIEIGLLGSIAASTLAADRYVAPDGSHTPPYTSWATASTNLKVAVDYANAASAGDTVWITNGTYVLTNQVVVNNTIVRGFSGEPGDVIVDGNGTVRCFYLNHANAVVQDLTMSNGLAANGIKMYYGGGACVMTGTLNHCVLIRNAAAPNWTSLGYGGGAYCGLPGALISNCTFIANSTMSLGGGGGGLYMDGGLAVSCFFSNNTITNQGGGVQLNAGGTVRNSTFVGNKTISTGGGGGAGAYVVTGVVDGCSFSGNVSMRDGGGIMLMSSAAVVMNSTSRWNCSGTGVNYGYGGGAALYGGLVTNCVINGNTNLTGAGGGGVYMAGTCTVANTTISGNAIFLASYNGTLLALVSTAKEP